MADKAISELIEAQQVTPADLFVLEQAGSAKKLSGQTLENWLVSFADGHGGIQSIQKVGTDNLQDTYRITLADTTTFDFVVTNGRAISEVRQTALNALTHTYTIEFNDGTSQDFDVIDGRGVVSVTKVRTSGLQDTYRIQYNDNTFDEIVLTNGAKGDKGDNTYTHIKFAAQEPTEANPLFSDVPDKWIGFYWGSSAEPPADYSQYKWYQFKGDQGDMGLPATLVKSVVEYQVGTSGTVVPSEAWSTSVPTVPQSKYLWTRVTTTFNTGAPIVSYSVARMGLDGLGSVVSINNIAPNAEGNVHLVAADVGARDNTWLPTIADIGAAPAGYGLGGDGSITLRTLAEVDAFKVSGWRRVVLDTGNIGGSAYGTLFCDAGDRYITQTFEFYYALYGGYVSLKRVRVHDEPAWKEWEWVNPPMIPGTEYRTTERNDGDVVYAKSVRYSIPDSIGDASGATVIDIPHGISDFGHIVRCDARSGAYTLPSMTSAGGSTSVNTVTGTNIKLLMHKDKWSGSVYFYLYYTKDA